MNNYGIFKILVPVVFLSFLIQMWGIILQTFGFDDNPVDVLKAKIKSESPQHDLLDSVTKLRQASTRPVNVGHTYYTRGHFIADVMSLSDSGDMKPVGVCEVEVNRLLYVKSYFDGHGALVIHMKQDEHQIYDPIPISNAPDDCEDRQDVFVNEAFLSSLTPYSKIKGSAN